MDKPKIPMGQLVKEGFFSNKIVKDDLHVDYKTIMDANGDGDIRFPELYEQAICNIEDAFKLPAEVKEQLSKKRDFGLKKYGEYSFQTSLKNTLNVPTIKHLREEIIDSYNYTMHEFYKRNILGDNNFRDELIEIMKHLNKIWKITEDMENYSAE
jgi:flagellin-specific chaperone FliS